MAHKGFVCLWLGRHVGLPRQRPDAEEVLVHHDEERGGEGRTEEEVEVAADPTEQGGERDRAFFFFIYLNGILTLPQKKQPHGAL